jgi:hypothetical protein
MERFKCRYVACGYNQTEGVDYLEHHTSAPTGHHATLRVLMVYAISKGLNIRHIDISTAFLHGELSEVVYVEQPPMLNDGADRVWRLKKSLHGLKQAGRQRYIKLTELLNKMGFMRAGYDPALFVRRKGSRLQYIFLWVDDLLIVASQEECDNIFVQALDEYKGRDFGEVSWVLGMEI